jgi:hypothetical protein
MLIDDGFFPLHTDLRPEDRGSHAPMGRALPSPDGTELSHGGIGLRRTYLESSSKCFRKVIIATPTTAAICFCGHEPALFCVYAAQPSLSRL